MSRSTVAIIGSGVAATAIAWTLTARGHDVVIFEKGPEYPYPHVPQFNERVRYLYYPNPAYELPPHVKAVTVSGDYPGDLNAERGMVVGGSATHWTAMTLRMMPTDFRTRTLYGFGADWPLGYDDLEPYYCQAETLLGVSGTDSDNPFAPPRSKPYPLPPFELSYDDRLLAARLRDNGIVLHTTPQARTRMAYDGRPQCANFGQCRVCPIGARYSPNHHLQRLRSSGRCKVVSRASVRRLLLDRFGRADTIVYRGLDDADDHEHHAKVIFVAAGAIESPRLLLLSSDQGHPDGLGNAGGHVGRHLVLHHLWEGTLHYREALYAGRVGPVTGQAHQFLEPETRGRHGAIKVEFSSHYVGRNPETLSLTSADECLNYQRLTSHRRGIVLHAESIPTDAKYLRLSNQRDRFGDAFAHVHYEASEFDDGTYRYAEALFGRFAHATGGEPVLFQKAADYYSGAHHMGTCRMGHGPDDSVVDPYGAVHGIPNLFVAGSSVFAGGSGAVNPTLTLTALAIRSADYVAQRLL